MGGGGGGGGAGGSRSSDLRPPPLVRESICKEKNLQDRGLNPHTVATRHKEVLNPPTHSPRKGVPRYGGGGRFKMEKFIGGQLLKC